MKKLIFRSLICSLMIAVLAVGTLDAKTTKKRSLRSKVKTEQVTDPSFSNDEAIKMLNDFFDKEVRGTYYTVHGQSFGDFIKSNSTTRFYQKYKKKVSSSRWLDCDYFTGSSGEECDDYIESVKAIGNGCFKVAIKGHLEGYDSPEYFTTTLIVKVVKVNGKYLIDDSKVQYK